MKLKLGSWALIISLLAAPQRLLGGYFVPTLIYSLNEQRKKPAPLSQTELQRIFTRRLTRWNTGAAIIVYIKPMDSIEHRNFVSSVLGMTMYRYRKSLEANTGNDQRTMVKEVRTDAEMLSAVYAHPGAIGYLNYSDEVDAIAIIIFDSRRS